MSYPQTIVSKYWIQMFFSRPQISVHLNDVKLDVYHLLHPFKEKNCLVWGEYGMMNNFALLFFSTENNQPGPVFWFVSGVFFGNWVTPPEDTALTYKHIPLYFPSVLSAPFRLARFLRGPTFLRGPSLFWLSLGCGCRSRGGRGGGRR